MAFLEWHLDCSSRNDREVHLVGKQLESTRLSLQDIRRRLDTPLVGQHLYLLDEVESTNVSLRAIARLAPRRMLDSHRGEIGRPAEHLLAKAAWLDDTIGLIDRARATGKGEREILRELFGGEAAVSYVSGGDLSRMNFIRAVLRAAN